MKNPGKIFEEEIRDSIPEGVFYYRLKDPAHGFGKSGTTRFALHNQCDIFLYRYPIFIAIELKSTKGTSISFSLEDNDHMIKGCQIKGLSECSKYKGITSGLLLNFRKSEKTYWIKIEDFIKFTEKTEKKSINEKDIKENKGIEINGKKKRIRYKWEIEQIVEDALNGVIS